MRNLLGDLNIKGVGRPFQRRSSTLPLFCTLLGPAATKAFYLDIHRYHFKGLPFSSKSRFESKWVREFKDQAKEQ